MAQGAFAAAVLLVVLRGRLESKDSYGTRWRRALGLPVRSTSELAAPEILGRLYEFLFQTVRSKTGAHLLGIDVKNATSIVAAVFDFNRWFPGGLGDR